MSVIIHGDTFKLITGFKDGEFDCVLTDPPYDLSKEQQTFLHEQFQRVCDGPIIVFSPPENQWITPAEQYLFWIKPISTKNTSRRYSRFVEMIFVYGNGTWNPGRHWSQYTNVFTDLVDDSALHPHRKPPSLIERLILNHTNPGDHIFDPFSGSHVVSDVALQLDRRQTAIEIDKSYV